MAVLTVWLWGCRFQQCELMTAHYKQPVLLIEFDEKKSFNIEVSWAYPVTKFPRATLLT